MNESPQLPPNKDAAHQPNRAERRAAMSKARKAKPVKTRDKKLRRYKKKVPA